MRTGGWAGWLGVSQNVPPCSTVSGLRSHTSHANYPLSNNYGCGRFGASSTARWQFSFQQRGTLKTHKHNHKNMYFSLWLPLTPKHGGGGRHLKNTHPKGIHTLNNKFRGSMASTSPLAPWKFWPPHPPAPAPAPVPGCPPPPCGSNAPRGRTSPPPPRNSRSRKARRSAA